MAERFQKLAAWALFAVVPTVPAAAQPTFEQRLAAAHARLDGGDAAGALAAFEALTADHPREPAAQFGRAAALLETGRIDDALPILLTLEELAPEEAATQAYLLRAEAASGREEAARARLDKLRRLAPYADLFQLQTLEWLFPSGLDALAGDQARFVSEMVTSDAVRGRALYLGGLLARRGGDHPRALELLEASVAADPSKLDVWAALLATQGATDIGDVDAATLERARKRFPDSPLILALAALRAIRLERLDEARALEPRIRAADPQQADLVLGRIELESLRFEEAAAAFRRVLEADPNDARALRDLGVSLARQGRLREALDLLERSLEAAPDDRQALFETARAQVDVGRLEDAAQTLDRLLAQPSRERKAVYLMFQIQRRLGNEEAMQRWRQKLPER